MSGDTSLAHNGDNDTEIRNRIRQSREALEWSVEDLAHRLGVTVDTVEAWEEGVRDPRSNRIVMLAGVLGVSAHWLLDGSDEFAPSPEGENVGTAARAQLESIRMKIRELEALVNDLESQLNTID